jgi:hypothetical protein
MRPNPSIERTFPGKAGSSLSSQTLGITVGRHAFGPPQPSLSLESNAPALLCFFGSVHQILGALFKAPPFGHMALTRCNASRPWSYVAGSFHPSVCGVGGGCCSASNQSVVGASRRSAAPGGQSVGAAAYGGSFLSLRACSAVVVAKSRGVFTFAGSGPCQRVMPNPSINRTCPGKPGHAGYLKRWAALTKHRAMRSSVEPSVAGHVLLAWPSTNALAPGFTASEVLVARPRSAQARCHWSAAAGTVPTGVASRGFASPASRARARSMHRCYPVSWLAAVGARRVPRHAECESPCTRTAAKVARLAAPVRHRFNPTGAAQPFNQPDMPRQAGSCRLSQTLGLRVPPTNPSTQPQRSNMRSIVSVVLVLSLVSCSTYQPPAGASSKIQFAGNHRYAYIDYGNSCSSRSMVDKSLWSGTAIKEGARVWIEQGIDTSGLAYGMSCGFHYSFEPKAGIAYVSEYSNEGGSCNISLYQVSVTGIKTREPSVHREPKRTCLL